MSVLKLNPTWCELRSVIQFLLARINIAFQILLMKREFLLNDSASSHIAIDTKEFFDLFRWDMINHPAPSSDLSPSNFHHFTSPK